MIRRRTLLAHAAAPLLAVGMPGVMATAHAQGADPPTLLGRVRWHVGPLEVSQGGLPWREASLNVPLSNGSQLRTGPLARAELRLGPTALYLGLQSTVHLKRWDETGVVVEVVRGQALLMSRQQALGGGVPPGARLETGAVGWQLDGDGSVHVLHLPVQRRAEVDVFDGEVRLRAGAGDGPLLRAGTALAVDPRSGAVLGQGEAEQRRLDAWAAQRQQRSERLDPALRRGLALTGAEDLARHGTWRPDSRWGPLWTPLAVDPAWAPFRQGHWWWLPPWGWHWVDEQPWGFVTAHHGRWIFAAGRWSWSPGSTATQPVYLPAAVAFLELPGAAVAAGPEGAIGWFPLAPGEPYRPPYEAGERYRTMLHATQPDARAPQQLRHAQTSFAVSLLPRGRFGQPDVRAAEVLSPSPAQLAAARALDGRQLPAP